jgi:hypothetical protein
VKKDRPTKKGRKGQANDGVAAANNVDNNAIDVIHLRYASWQHLCLPISVNSVSLVEGFCMDSWA